MSPSHRMEFAPAKVLLLLRDRVANDWPSLCREFHMKPKEYHSGHYMLRRVLEELRTAGLIRFENGETPDRRFEEGGIKGRIEVSPDWERIQTALGISLVEIAELRPSESMVIKPYFGPPSDPPNKSDVFVLMPFVDELRPVYTDHIAKVVQSLKLTVSRADDFFSAHSVMSDIWNAICNARLIIADCTNRNPNVFYEIGIAHVVGKTVVLITQKQEDIPFDIRHYRFIEYKYTPRGIQEFESRLKETIKTEMLIFGEDAD